jgi:nucleotidyltransferase substrate binding protein (TIGR01987 family)
MNLIYNINVEPFFKACATFEKFRKSLNTDQEKAGAIQAFEFSYELAWKTMKRILQAKGIEARSPRDCFREAASIGMISDPKQWFIFIDKRNMTVHAYEENVVEEIIAIFDNFSASLNELIKYIQNEQIASQS